MNIFSIANCHQAEAIILLLVPSCRKNVPTEKLPRFIVLLIFIRYREGILKRIRMHAHHQRWWIQEESYRKYKRRMTETAL